MIIVPKLGEHNLNIPDCVKPYISNKLEIQLSGRNLIESWDRCEKIICNIGTLDEVVLHMPFNLHTLEIFIASREYQNKLVIMLVRIMRFSQEHNVRVGLLFHSEDSLELFNIAHGLEYVEFLVNLVSGSNIYFLIENAICEMNSIVGSHIPAFEMLEMLPYDNVKFCFDLCHFLASEYIYDRELVIPQNVVERTHSIHFSATLDRDGYKDKRATHSRVHKCESDLKTDVKWLIYKGFNIKDTMIVAEITESDYVLRPDMRKEMDMLRKIADKLQI